MCQLTSTALKTVPTQTDLSLSFPEATGTDEYLSVNEHSNKDSSDPNLSLSFLL